VKEILQIHRQFHVNWCLSIEIDHDPRPSNGAMILQIIVTYVSWCCPWKLTILRPSTKQVILKSIVNLAVTGA
jgi:hypothetical protein